jgi:hypothetical protein
MTKNGYEACLDQRLIFLIFSQAVAEMETSYFLEFLIKQMKDDAFELNEIIKQNLPNTYETFRKNSYRKLDQFLQQMRERQWDLYVEIEDLNNKNFQLEEEINDWKKFAAEIENQNLEQKEKRWEIIFFKDYFFKKKISICEEILFLILKFFL